MENKQGDVITFLDGRRRATGTVIATIDGQDGIYYKVKKHKQYTKIWETEADLWLFVSSENVIEGEPDGL